MNIRLECTCSACPEQYWAYTDDIEGGDRIGYIRLRWGHLTCEYLMTGKLDKESVLVYEHTFVGDEYKGKFDTEEERTHFLEKCKEALIEKHSKKGELPMSEDKIKYFCNMDELEDRVIAMRIRSCIVYCYPFVEEVAKHGAKILTASGKLVKHVQPAIKDGEKIIVGEMDGQRLVWDIDGNSASGDETLRLCIPERYFMCSWKSFIKLSNSEWCLKYQRPHPTVKIPDAWAEKSRRRIND